MDENLHNIEDLFFSNLEDYEDAPSQNVWKAVDKQLDKDKVVSIKRKYTNLKKIAVSLLLLLLSSLLYEINFTYKNNRIAKNSGIDAGNQNKSGIVTDKGLNKSKPTASLATVDTTSAPNNKKENLVPDRLDDEKITSRQQSTSNNTQPLQKQNGNKINNSEKDNKEDLTSLTTGQKKKLATKAVYNLKIKNGTSVQDEQPLAKNNNERIDNKISILGILKNTSAEEIKLQSNDSIDGKKLLQSIVSVKGVNTDSSINSLMKTNNKKVTNPSRFSLTPFFSPDIAWYRLQDDKVDNQSDNAQEIQEDEKHEFSSTFGVLVDYKINKHWGVQSGATISNTNITVQPKTIYAQPDISGSIKYRINTSSGFGYLLPSFSANPIIGDSLYAFTSTHSLQYIGIPLAATYSVLKGKFKLNAMAGVSTNILTRATLETTVEKGFDNSLETVNNLLGLKKLYFSGLMGVGVDYKLSGGTSLTFEPTMRFALNSITKNATVKSYPMSLGFAVGLKIDL